MTRVSSALSPLRFLNSGALTEKSALITYTFQPIPVVRPIDALPLPSESQLLELSGRLPERQSNKPACGGARLSDNRAGSADSAWGVAPRSWPPDVRPAFGLATTLTRFTVIGKVVTV